METQVPPVISTNIAFCKLVGHNSTSKHLKLLCHDCPDEVQHHKNLHCTVTYEDSIIYFVRIDGINTAYLEALLS